MKTYLMIATICFLSLTSAFGQTKKSGITNFSINGYEQPMGISSLDDKSVPEPNLYFIGDGSTELSPGVRVSDEIVKYTEAQLKAYLGYDLVPVELNRPATVLNQTEGRLWVMETITDKKAFKQLGYDEVIELQCRIGSAGKTGKYYKPFIELKIKITDKDGKTVWKKTEKLKLSEKIPANMIEEQRSSGGLVISFSQKGGMERGGITAAQLLDWYKQVLGNALIKE